MPAQTEKQKRFFGAVEGAKHGEKGVSGKAKKVAKEISDKDAKKFLKVKGEDEEMDEDEETKSYSAKKAHEGKDIGKSNKGGKNGFKAVADKASKEYGSKEAGKKVAGAVLSKLRKEEDEESVSKKMKKDGKAVFDGPKVKERKKSAPATQVHKDKKKYDRKKKDDTVQENMDIINFINCLLTKKYASANKYLNNAVELKIQKHIEAELETPLFQ